MRTEFGKLLARYTQVSVPHVNRPSNTRVAVIVETRDDYFLPLVLRNFAEKLGDDWNIQVVATEAVRASLAAHAPEVEFRYTALKVGAGAVFTVGNYSALLLHPSFWSAIEEETVLIFQLDTVLLRPVPREVEKYDFIGAPCGDLREGHFTCNGGLSLRSRKAMLSACTIPECIGESAEPEDVAFMRLMRSAGTPTPYRLPDIEEARRFFTESIMPAPGDFPVGVHGTTKHWLADADILALLHSYN